MCDVCVMIECDDGDEELIFCCCFWCCGWDWLIVVIFVEDEFVD